MHKDATELGRGPDGTLVLWFVALPELCIRSSAHHAQTAINWSTGRLHSGSPTPKYGIPPDPFTRGYRAARAIGEPGNLLLFG